MNILPAGAAKRPKLSLHYGVRREPAASRPEPCSTALADHELRQIVAAMIG